MKFLAEINVMQLESLIDPHGKAVTSELKTIGLGDIDNVRIGKHITVEVEATDEESARNKVEEACQKLLANKVVETFTFTLNKIDE